MLKEIETRQSIRKYLDKDVDDEKIKAILESAMNAPSARNTQDWRFIVISNKKALSDMTNLSPYTGMMKSAPCAILVLTDLDVAINIEYGITNCAAAIENMLIEATHLGLGTCWCGIAPVEERMDAFKNYFNLNDNEYPVGVVAVGYPNEIKPLINRFDPSKVSYFK